jgi:EH domain-containing protein 1
MRLQQLDGLYLLFGDLQMQTPLAAVTSVIDGLKRLYVEKLKPLEVACRFNDFASPLLV